MKPSRFLWFGVLILILNSAYLWPFAEPTLFYLGNLVLHLLLGSTPHHFYHSLSVEKFLQFVRVVTCRVDSIPCLLDSGFRSDEDWSVDALSLDFEDSHCVSPSSP